MGRGNGRAQASPISGIHSQGGEDGGAIAVLNPCEELRPIDIHLAAGLVVVLGMSVRIVAGNPPVVLAGRDQVGVVVGPDETDVNGCLDNGYRLVGVITDINQVEHRAVALIKGSLTD